MENPYNKGTIKWYKFEIKNNLTPEVNKRVFESLESSTFSPQLDKMVERLQKYGSTNKKYGEKYIGLGFTGKSKARLKRQYQELNRVLKMDIWSPTAIEEQEALDQQIYETFNKGRNWSKDKWRNFVQIMGNISSEMLRGFGYEQHGNDKGSKTVNADEKEKKKPKFNESLIEAFSEAYDKKKDMMEIMEKIYNEAERTRSGLTQQQMIDKLFEEIRKEMKDNGTV